jgi:hypothetical protein
VDRFTTQGPAGIRRLAAAGALALAIAAVAPLGVLADPNSGANSTPGTLTCPELGLDQVATTSGSPAARAVQIVGTSSVFIFRGAPDYDFFQGQGTEPRWTTCVLYEPGPGGVGTLTVVGYLSH